MPATRLSWGAVIIPLTLVCATAHAQKSDGEKKSGDEWKGLDVEPDPPPAPKPDPNAPNPRAPAPSKLTPTPVDPDPAPRPRPRPRPNEPSGDNQIVTENLDTTSSMPNEIMWMKEWKPNFATRHIRAEFDVWGHNAGTSFNWAVIGSVGVDDVPLWIDFEIPWTHLDADGPLDPEDPSKSSHTHFGNATFGFHGGGVIRDVVGLWGGAWVGVPSSPDISNVDTLTLVAAAGVRNIVDGHRFVPNSIPLRFGFGIDGQLFPLVYLRSEIYFSGWLPNVDYSEVDNVTVPLLLEQIHEVEGLSPIGLGLGFRFQSFINVDSASADPNDSGAHAVEPYIVYRPPYLGPYTLPIFARLGVLISVEEAAGFGALGEVVAMKSMVGYRF